MGVRTPVCELFGIEVPIFLAGMGGVAMAEVCAAVSEAGGFGVLGAAGLAPEDLRSEMRAVRERTDRPFGVDLLAALPDEVRAAVPIIETEGAAALITGLGVAEPMIGRCHDAGLKVMAIGGKVSHALAAQAAGCDAVVAQGTEAGGHTGLVAGMAVIPQTVDAVDIPVLAAGSIVDGRGFAAALCLGAQGIWVGTRFIASHEARAASLFKGRIVDADSADTTITRCYSGKPMRVIRNAYVEDWGRRPDELMPFPDQLVHSVREGLLGFSDDDEVKPERTAMPAGQGVGGIDDILPVAEIVKNFITEARQTLDSVNAWF
ncbi:MAG: nitronate monooxygenase [Deltaproteobacteria bacterium]|nr:nitronate monooxygenase [Deltaproteobacteria bacterium]MBW2360446.1 nitronate monooxygenase [Deltaproteobacteria bacterium]